MKHDPQSCSDSNSYCLPWAVRNSGSCHCGCRKNLGSKARGCWARLDSYQERWEHLCKEVSDVNYGSFNTNRITAVAPPFPQRTACTNAVQCKSVRLLKVPGPSWHPETLRQELRAICRVGDLPWILKWEDLHHPGGSKSDVLCIEGT